MKSLRDGILELADRLSHEIVTGRNEETVNAVRQCKRSFADELLRLLDANPADPHPQPWTAEDAARRFPESSPPPHRKYLVRRGPHVFTATPCYGMHNPWWVVKTMEGEADPVVMENGDRWSPIPASLLAAPADAEATK